MSRNQVVFFWVLFLTSFPMLVWAILTLARISAAVAVQIFECAYHGVRGSTGRNGLRAAAGDDHDHDGNRGHRKERAHARALRSTA